MGFSFFTRTALMAAKAIRRRFDGLERGAAEEAVVSDVGELVQRGFALGRDVPAQHRLDPSQGPILLPQRADVGGVVIDRRLRFVGARRLRLWRRPAGGEQK